MNKFSIRTRLLAAIAKWTYQGDDRPHLECVLFDGKHIVATDGHRIVVAPCETGLPSFLLRRRDCLMLAAAQRELFARQFAELAFVKVADRRASVSLDPNDGERCTVIVRTPVHDFPPYEALFRGLKAEGSPPPYAFEPRYLAAIDEVLEAVDGGHQRTVKITAWDTLAPMLFEGHGIRFLIMPQRM